MNKEKQYYCVIKQTNNNINIEKIVCSKENAATFIAKKLNVHPTLTQAIGDAPPNTRFSTEKDDTNTIYMIIAINEDNFDNNVKISISESYEKQCIIEDIKHAPSIYENNCIKNKLKEKDFEDIYKIYEKTKDCNIDYNSSIENAIRTFLESLDERLKEIAFNCINWLGEHFDEEETNEKLKSFGVDNTNLTVNDFSLSDKIATIESTLNYITDVFKNEKEDLKLALQHLDMDKNDFDFFDFSLLDYTK